MLIYDADSKFLVRAVLIQTRGLESLNGRDLTKLVIIDVNSMVSGQNYDVLSEK